MDLTDLIGQTLDGKYLIERELGRGGMGTVFLATHVGTERPVAVKVIAPQFMRRPEFVERFRREARAAGRLRHPNVVDVTDFGFSDTEQGRVAYLVMEYLDGCTLGEILEEEKNLPVGWTLDILEQVCSAVQEAHNQGIIHRDLKPENIWLEPNQRGGYTVKVLDFGIAKLEAVQIVDTGEHEIRQSAAPTFVDGSTQTITDLNESTIHDSISPTVLAEAATMAGIPHTAEPTESVASGVSSEARTAIFGDGDQPVDQERVGTKLISVGDDTDKADMQTTTDQLADQSLSTKDLTRVGAVLGTPLYMSPEQCSGNRLDARSDVYSIGVIAYQMLSGDTPFKGDFSKVMEAHKVLPPPPLTAKKVRKKLKRVINSALAKHPDARPQTAEAFASQLRSRSEGIFGLLRRAGMIWTEHISKFLILSTFFHLPMAVLTIVLIVGNFLKASELISETASGVWLGVVATSLSVITGFCAYLLIGTISWIVIQSLAVPLRPIRMRSALKEAGAKWKTFAGTGILSFLLTLVIGVLTCGIGFIVMNILWTLVAPVVMMENSKGMAALKRSKDLVMRSLATSTAAVALTFLIPAISAGAISFTVSMTAKALTAESTRGQQITRVVSEDKQTSEPETGTTRQEEKEEGSINYSIGQAPTGVDLGSEKGMRHRLIDTMLESLMHLFLLPLQILVTSFTAIIIALLYLKTRQAGGESLQDLLAKFEETDQPRKKWQERVRQRLIQSGRLTTATTSKP
jgi:serine/threonine protein kinase